MLFDLSSSRRRRSVVRVVYGFLALLMAASLFFVINGGVFQGNNSSGSGGSGNGNQSSLLKKQLTSATAETKRNPKSAKAWGDVVSARYQMAQAGSKTDAKTGTTTYNAAGKAQAKKAAAAYTKYHAVAKGKFDQAISQEAARMDAVAGNNAAAGSAWQDVAGTNTGGSKPYLCIALAETAAKNNKLAGSAIGKAMSMTPKIQRYTLVSQYQKAVSGAIGKKGKPVKPVPAIAAKSLSAYC
ncbi:MAG: hypothetical protein J2O48_09590 [Solirubrobacterales bacterium]|nr:hypothetical protein [Solirubrobacterales bacterium]